MSDAPDRLDRSEVPKCLEVFQQWLPDAPAARLGAALAAGELRELEAVVFKEIGAIAHVAFEAHLQACADRVDRRDAARAEQRAPRSCPRCGAAAGYWRRRVRQLVSTLGECQIERSEFRCACGHVFAPSDAALGLRPSGRLSPWLEALCEEFGATCGSYEEARRLLSKFVQRVPATATIGSAIVRRAAELDADDETRIAATRRAPDRQPLVPDAATSSDTLVIEVDGGMAPVRAGWREVKTGAMYLTRDRIENPPRRGAPQLPGRGRVTRSWTVGRIEAWTGFADRLHAQAVAVGARRAKRVVLLGDGAEWIDRLQRTHFPDAIRILDFWHAMEHVCEPARLFFGDDSVAFDRWRHRMKEHLARGRLPTVIAALRRLAPKAHAARRGTRANEIRTVVRTTVNYLRARKTQMDYPRFRALGLPIGSGLIEGRIKTLVKARLCRAGSRWLLTGANAVLRLRTHYVNHAATNTRHPTPTRQAA